MSYELSKEEKSNIINQHLKNLEYNKYTLRISLLEMNSGFIVKKESIQDIEDQILSINSKQKALLKELNSLEEKDNG